MYQHQGPVLDVCWNKVQLTPRSSSQSLANRQLLQEGNKIFSGGADNAGRMFDVNTGQATQVAQHDAPIKVVGWVDAQSGILATGSWDKTIKVSSFSLSWVFCQDPNIQSSTGTYALLTQWLRLHCQSGAILLTFNTL